MSTLVSLNLSGAIQQLAVGQPIEVGVGNTATTYLWSQLAAMSNTQLQELNIYVAPDPANPPAGKMVCGVVYELINNGIVTTPILCDVPLPIVPTPPPVLPVTAISRRQFFQQLAINKIITQTEALAAVKTGEIPPEFTAILTALPVAEQFSVEMILSGATEFDTNNTLTTQLATQFGWTADYLQTFWDQASLL